MKKIFYAPLLLLTAFIFYSCSSTSRIPRHYKNYVPSNSAPIKVMLNEQGFKLSYTVENPVILCRGDKAIALVKKWNVLNFSISGNGLKLNISGSSFDSPYFTVKPADGENSVSYKGRDYHGIIKFVRDGNTIRAVNQLPLEDYLKGVVPAEMPTGKDDSYFEALKAFAICARTYAINKLKSSGGTFDIYLDTRDQAYGGADAEKDISDLAVDETAGMILEYDKRPAKVFYHSSCGGHTENAKNVFNLVNVPYLQGVEDGNPPNCSIANNFTWEENYPENVFIERLRALTFIDEKSYTLKDVKIVSRDESGRVSLLTVTLISNSNDEKVIKLAGNKIRSVIRNSNNTDILRSTMFDISVNDNKMVTIKGKGYGHGVGLCQWGAIHQSVEGKNYKNILSFYFPGTDIGRIK